MLTLLSPAKKMNMDPAQTSLSETRPRFEADTKLLATLAKTKTPADLKKLMHISDNLATLNAERFQTFNLDGQSNSAKAAGLAFDGDVYWGLEAKSLSDDDLAYAQDHLRILSGLYGVLRPMDAIQPYRLEMGTKFENSRGKNLYEFWADTLAPSLNEELASHADQTIVNLASNEYFKAANTKALKTLMQMVINLTPRSRQMKSLSSLVLSLRKKGNRSAKGEILRSGLCTMSYGQPMEIWAV